MIVTMKIWFLILTILVCVGAGILLATIVDKTVGKETKITLVEQWLKYVVILAERKFGSGTGKLKFTYVYNQFIEKWPTIASWMSEEQFGDLVNTAIAKMEALRNNEAINNFINNFGLTELENDEVEG